MATQYPSDRQNQGNNSRYSQPSGQRPAARPASGISRPSTTRPSSGARPASSSARPAGTRPAGTRPAGSSARPAGSSQQVRRPAPQGARPNPNGSRRPPQRRKKKPQGRFYAIIAVAIVLIIAIVLLVAKPFGKKPDPQQAVTPTAAPAAVTDAAVGETEAEAASRADQLAALLGDSDAEVEGLSAEEMAVVTDLSINQNLPDEWMNILLLGSDERTLEESARTDSMMICSVNLQTGEVKLTSIMRDLAVKFDDIGKYNGTYRINSANYFGGEKLAMRTVNECFGMNIDKYVRVNLYSFMQVAEILGGVEMDITEAEMNEINRLVVDLYKEAARAGIDESNLPQNILETYGPNTHLDSRQTLAYARIRKIDSDYARAERQRKVLNALMNKLKGAGAAELAMLGASCMPYFQTNMTLDEIIAIAVKVLGSGLDSIESFRLPVNDTYVQERRNNQEMFYDCDWSANASHLYNFIYAN